VSTWLDGRIKTVRDFDASRPRSMQSAVGWSEVGGCRAQLGYRLEGAWPSDDTDTWGAQRGTAIHAYLQEILAAPGVRMEVDTEYRGIPGHADIVDAAGCTDIKTTKLANSMLWAADHKLLFEKRVQVHGYGAGLVDAGELPDDATMRLLVVPVDGAFGDWWAYEEPFDRSLADHGADRLEEVRRRMEAGERLPKDKPFAFCESWCLAGETEVVTRNGIRPISELAGSSHQLLAPPAQGGGEWQECEVRSFGMQPLMAVTLRRSSATKVVYATSDHRWITRRGDAVTTVGLTPGTQLRSIRHRGASHLREVPFAIAQGFIYGDGSRGSKGSAGSLRLYDKSPKPKAMLGYFAGHDIQAMHDGWLVRMLPSSWKNAPSMSESRSFLASWLAGYIAADGCVSEAGQTTISCAFREGIEIVRSICAIVGVSYSAMRSQSRISRDATEPTDLFSVNVRTRDLPEWAFKLEPHRRRAQAAREKAPHDLNWIVESVTPTDRVEEVFCAVVPGSNAFALTEELLTHNCEFFSLCRSQDDPKAGEEITDPELAAAVAAYGEAHKVFSAAKKEKERLAPLIRGLRGTTGDWRVSLGAGGAEQEVLDEDEIRADYERRGFAPPMTTRPGSAPRLNVTRIRKAAS
jgi:hypothetical protein